MMHARPAHARRASRLRNAPPTPASMPRIRRSLATPALTCLTLALAAACRSATSPDSVYPSLTAVYGRVLRAGGAPVAGVFVTAAGYAPPCGPAPAGTPHAEGSPPYVTTDSAGGYRLVLNTPRQEALCVVVRVGATGAALTGTAPALAEARVDSVPFRLLDVQGGARAVRDSLRVDLAVP